MLGACQWLVGNVHALEFRNNLTKLFVVDVIFQILFTQILTAVFFDFVSRCVLQELAPVGGAVVIGAAIFQGLQQEAISRAGERGVGAAKIAAAYFWVVGGWCGHGEGKECATRKKTIETPRRIETRRAVAARYFFCV